MNWLDEIDFCIKTYKRPKALERLLASIEKFYPGAQVTVNHGPCIAAGRNAMVAATKRPFLLMLDDDFIFTEETNIEPLYLELQAEADAGVAGGVVMDLTERGRIQRQSGGNAFIKGRAFYLTSRLRGMLSSKWCDIVPNFCLIRREVFETCRYRWGIGAEHGDFFLQVRDADWRVLQRDDVRIDHDVSSPADPGYKAARWATGENILRFMDHWGIDRIVVNGSVVHSRPMETV